jgi:DNA polymerase delta subunit 1
MAERELIQVIDIAEEFDSRTLRETICLFGRKPDNTLIQVHVKNIPNEVYIAIGEDFANDLKQLSYLKNRINKDIIKQQEYEKCMRTKCDTCGGGHRENATICRDPCIRHRITITDPIICYDVVRKRGFHGYEENDRPFLRLILSHAFYANSIEKWYKKHNLAFGNVTPQDAGIYELRSKPVDSFLALIGVGSFAWLSFPCHSEDQKAQRNYYVSYRDLQVVPKENVPPPVKLVSMFLDIETIAKKYVNSESDKSAYPVGVISTVMATGEKRSFMYGQPNVQLPHVFHFDSEVDMLIAFYDYVMEKDPDIISGYNSNLFDVPYLFRRAERLNITKFQYMSRLSHTPVLLQRQQTFSQQNKTLAKVTIDCPGRIFLDLLPIVRETEKLPSYKLAEVAKHYELESKGDIAYKDLFRHFYGSIELRRELEKYCMRDTELCDEIQIKTNAILQLVAKCEVLRIRARDILDRGLGYKLSMLIAGTYRSMGYVNKKTPAIWDAELQKSKKQLDAKFLDIEGYEDLWDLKERHDKYPGAFVFPPQIGLYWSIIFTLDFNSLYPSIIITMNICRSTQLKSPAEDPDANVSPCVLNGKPCPFAYSKKKEGVFPRIERELIAARKKVRKEHAAEKDHVKKAALFALQLQLKIAANSLYGLLGTTTSEVSLLSGAFSITAWGAHYIQRVCKYLEENHSDEVAPIYGDTDSLFINLVGLQDIGIGQDRASFYEKLVNEKMVQWLEEDYHIPKGTIVLKMEAENLSYPFLLLGKKNYVKVIYEVAKTSTKPAYMKLAGLETRALCKYTQEAMTDLLEAALMKKESHDALVERIRKWMKPLYTSSIERSDYDKLLKTSTNLSKPITDYKGVNKPTHVVAAQQMLDDDLSVNCGDRIEYYFCEVPTTKMERKSESVVAAHLIDKYELKWSHYIAQMRKMIEKCMSKLVKIRLLDIFDPTSYSHVKVFRHTLAPKRTAEEGSLAMMFRSTKKQKEDTEEEDEDKMDIVKEEDEEERTRIEFRPAFRQMLLPGAVVKEYNNISATEKKQMKQLENANKQKKNKSGKTGMNLQKAVDIFAMLRAPKDAPTRTS